MAESVARSVAGAEPSAGPIISSVPLCSSVGASSARLIPARVGGRTMASSFLYTSRMIEHVDACTWK